MAKRKRTSFSRQVVIDHLRSRHGNCPAEVAQQLTDELATREWETPLTLGMAFGLLAQAKVRHTMTDYDRLLRLPGITREEARLIVNGEVQAIIASWKSGGTDQD